MNIMNSYLILKQLKRCLVDVSKLILVYISTYCVLMGGGLEDA